MTDPKEFESLDQLFRKTFDDLPETPAPSGWDTPSERVWQHVQAQIKPPRAGWSTRTITVLAAFAVTLAVGLFLYLSRSEKTETPAETAVASETPASPAATGSTETQEQSTAAIPEKNIPTAGAKQARKQPGAQGGKKTPEPALNPSQKAQTAKPDSGESVSVRPSAKKPVSPNSTERRKQELARRAETAWQTPLAPLPPHWPKLQSEDSPR